MAVSSLQLLSCLLKQKKSSGPVLHELHSHDEFHLAQPQQLVVSDLWCTLLISFWQNNLQQLHTISLSPLGNFSDLLYELQAPFFVLCPTYTLDSESSVVWRNSAL